MSFTAPVRVGDVLTAVATEQNITRRTGIYQVVVSNQEGKKIGIFKGIVIRKEEEWFPHPNKE
jgi:acyl-CoA thioesterase